MREFTYEEFHSYFWRGELFYITKYFNEIVSKTLEGTFDLKCAEKGHWWYSDWKDHSRMVINMWPRKGGSYIIEWGYNFDFIPHVTNQNKIVWHRTEKAFRTHIADNFFSYIDYDPDKLTLAEAAHIRSKYQLPETANNLDVALEFIEDVVKRNIPFMVEWFDRVQTIEQMIDELDRQIAIFSPYGHYNEHWTKAFLLARLNRMDEVKEAMKYIYRNREIDPRILEKLQKASEIQ